MPIDVIQEHDGIAEVVIDHPPVNALGVAAGSSWPMPVRRAGTRLTASPRAGQCRGFCAGVDIKEINAKGDGALVGVNRGCAAAFAAVYECEVPVVAAVQGFCLGGGIGLAGNADIVVASEDATFGLPEVDRWLSARPPTSRALSTPNIRMRSMVYSGYFCRRRGNIHSYGSIFRVVP